MTKPWRNITTIWSDKKNCVFVFISVNLTGDSTKYMQAGPSVNRWEACFLFYITYCICISNRLDGNDLIIIINNKLFILNYLLLIFYVKFI